MATTHAFHYRGYEIVPTRQWANWCVGIYATRADLPLMRRSTLRTLAPRNTQPGEKWFPWFRVYGPEKAISDKNWRLPDIERMG